MDCEQYAKEYAAKVIEELLYWLLDPKAIDGAIRSAIHAHGPVTRINSFSTSKRVRGAMKTRAQEFLNRGIVLPCEGGDDPS